MYFYEEILVPREQFSAHKNPINLPDDQASFTGPPSQKQEGPSPLPKDEKERKSAFQEIDRKLSQ